VAVKGEGEARPVASGPGGVNVADSANEPIVRTKVAGDAFDRYVLTADGTAYIGDGTDEPAAQSGTSGLGGDTALLGSGDVWSHFETADANGVIMQSDYEQGGAYSSAPQVLRITARGAIISQAWLIVSGTMDMELPQFMIGAKSDLTASGSCFAAEAGTSDSALFTGIDGLNKVKMQIRADGSIRMGDVSIPAVGVTPSMDVALTRYAAGKFQIVAATGSQTQLVIRKAGAADTDDLLRFRNDADSATLARVDVSGRVLSPRFAHVDWATGAGVSLAAALTGFTFISAATTHVPLTVQHGVASGTGDLTRWQDSTADTKTRINGAGYFFTKKASAPPDADIGTGEAAMWIDTTPAASKVMFKMKDSAGTVKTGSVAMA
jgi:hypothetical protein